MDGALKAASASAVAAWVNDRATAVGAALDARFSRPGGSRAVALGDSFTAYAGGVVSNGGILAVGPDRQQGLGPHCRARAQPGSVTEDHAPNHCSAP
ncbi:hypothetical protein SAMN05661080_00868 [Modestobacter sp. DSM 44400]|nr:hypothetical protein SAMN05661080_00868 [Modestobacter sp. DSM 44400]